MEDGLAPGVVFVGIDRAAVIRRELTRKNMAELLGITYPEFRDRFAWTNLYGEESAPSLPKNEREAEDRRRAEELLRVVLPRYQRAVLLGTCVATAFGLAHLPLYEWTSPDSSTLLLARMPHTSQTNWNTRGRGRGPYWDQARAFARTLTA